MKKDAYRRIGVGGIVLLAIAGILAAATDAPASPPVSWNPASLDESVTSGDVLTIPVSFTASKNLPNVVVRVVPELAAIVSVSPATIGDVGKHETVTLEVTIAPPATMTPQLLEGAIQLRHGGHPPRTYARPLSVSLNVEWPQASTTIASVDYPPTWTADVLSPVPDSPLTERLVLTSPAGTRLVVSPEGALPFDIIGEVYNETLATIAIDGHTSERYDFFLDNEPAFSYLNVLGVPDHPDFRINVWYESAEDAVAVEQIISSITVEN